jgi:uncharacterized protein (TIGR02444 family)
VPRNNIRDDVAGEAFWRFSLALYARPGVADALIALQDRAGLDVKLILFGAWLGACQGIELGDGFAAAADSVTELNGAVRNIRALRRQLEDAGDGASPRLRCVLLRVELAAERRVQRRLATWFAAGTLTRMPGDGCGAAHANLARCLGDETDSPEAAVLRRALAGLTRRA